MFGKLNPINLINLNIRKPMYGIQAFFYSKIAVDINIPLFHILEIILGERIEESENILDIGTGPGHFPEILSEYKKKIFAVEPSDDMIKIASKRLRNKNVFIVKGDACNLPFRDEKFDIVTSNFSIKHWPDQEKGLREIFRVLKKGGIAWIVDAQKNPKKESYNFFKILNPKYLLIYPVLKFFLSKEGIDVESLTRLVDKIGFKGKFKTSKFFPISYAILKKI